jgi:hypothetical protein
VNVFLNLALEFTISEHVEIMETVKNIINGFHPPYGEMSLNKSKSTG